MQYSHLRLPTVLLTLFHLALILQPNLALSQTYSTFGSSFDCARDRADLTLFICNDPHLRRTDLDQMKTYYVLRHISPERQAFFRNQYIERVRLLVSECSIELGVSTGAVRACVDRKLIELRQFWQAEVDSSGNLAARFETRLPIEQLFAIQEGLKARSLLPANSVSDGVFGTGTRTALRRFQEEGGLRVDGFVDHETLRRLTGTSLQDFPAQLRETQGNATQGLRPSTIDDSNNAFNTASQEEASSGNILNMLRRVLVIIGALGISVFFLGRIGSFVFILGLLLWLLIAPILLENAENSCHALEKHLVASAAMLNQDKSLATRIDRFIERTVIRFSDGSQIANLMRQRHPNFPPALTCSTYYWVLFFNRDIIE
jgi:hypothetical protein